MPTLIYLKLVLTLTGINPKPNKRKQIVPISQPEQ